jgi:hypothetical protein
LVNKELKEIIEFLEDKVEGKDFVLSFNNNMFLKIFKRKEKEFNEFKELLKSRYQDFILNNQKKVVKSTYITFFYDNLNEFLKIALTFYGFDEDSLKFINIEKISDSDLIIEHEYYLSPEEEEMFNKLAIKAGHYQYPFDYYVGYLYFAISCFGIISRMVIQENFLILLDGAALRLKKEGHVINLMVTVRDSKDELYDNYLKMSMIYFLKQYPEIPEDFKDDLMQGREKLYHLSLNNYSKRIPERLTDLLYHLYKKSVLIQNFTPLLDFLNFVCSRVEDSKFTKVDIIRKEFLSNLDYTEEKKNSLIKIFEFLDSKSSLYSTFASNNLPSPREQFNLFILFTKYYLAKGLEVLEAGDLLLLPGIFKNTLNTYNKNSKQAIDAKAINRIVEFLKKFSIVNNIEENYMFFQKIFQRSVSDINYWLLNTFLTSLNKKFSEIISEENKKISENPKNDLFEFNIVVDHICRMLYVLIEKIFIRNTPEEASENFFDPRGRYTGRNIALRVNELFLFRDMNFSDDVWPLFIISLNKEKVQKKLSSFVDIPDNYFYRNKDILKFLLIYNFRSFSDSSFFEEWLITEMILPLNDFILNITSSVENPSNKIEVYEKLKDVFLEDVEDKDLIKSVQFICQELASFWENLEDFD